MSLIKDIIKQKQSEYESKNNVALNEELENIKQEFLNLELTINNYNSPSIVYSVKNGEDVISSLTKELEKEGLRVSFKDNGDDWFDDGRRGRFYLTISL